MRMTSRAFRFLALILAGALALGACGGGDDGDGDDGASDPSASESQGDQDGTTDAGSSLEFGDSATLTWKPKENLEGQVEVTVKRAVQATMKDFSAFKLDASMRKSTPYYVKVGVENTGETDLSGLSLPLFLDNGTDVLFPPAKINSSFSPCPSRPLPKKFVNGKTANLCLVFLANEGTELQSISMRADETEPTVDWTGEVTDPNAAKKSKQGKKNKKGTGKKAQKQD